MKKVLLTLLFLSNSVQAGFYDSAYFEPTALCAVAGGAMYVTTDGDNRMRNAAIGCGAGALVGYFIGSYYDNKYGQQFDNYIKFEMEKLNKNKIRKLQKYDKVDNPYVKRVKRVLPAQKLPTGDIILPRVEEDIQLLNSHDRIGN